MNSEEQFWQGEFGDNYTARNINFVDNNYRMFQKIFYKELDHIPLFTEQYLKYTDINSIIEFGAGSGQNILALQKIFPDARYTAIEINETAIKSLKEIDGIGMFTIINSSILNYKHLNKHNLVLSKGLLIHIHPDNIQKAYDVLYNASNKYILLCEYYSPERREILYRGEHNKLWSFDFIKPMLDKGCTILDYGFVSKYDKYFEDDLTWALFQK